MTDISVYDDSFLNEEQKKQIRAFTQEWWRAHEAGDQAGMDAAHAAAERVRATAGYSGGDGGWEYHELGSSKAGAGASGVGALGQGTPAALASYEPREKAVNDLYDAALGRELAGLRAAYEAGSAAVKESREAVPRVFQDEKNDLAAQSAVAERNFEEYAAGTGLASGAKGQARLAMENTRQAGMSALDAQEGAALAEADRQEAELKRAYQDGIAKAVAEGAYERAAALLEEYRKAEESRVSVSQKQADEYFRWRQELTKELEAEAERLRKEAGV